MFNRSELQYGEDAYKQCSTLFCHLHPISSRCSHLKWMVIIQCIQCDPAPSIRLIAFFLTPGKGSEDPDKWRLIWLLRWMKDFYGWGIHKRQIKEKINCQNVSISGRDILTRHVMINKFVGRYIVSEIIGINNIIVILKTTFYATYIII